MNDLRVLVCAPVGRDTALTVGLLTRSGIESHACDSVAGLCADVEDGAGAIVLTEEVLSDPGIDSLARTLTAQPAWSDISILLFTGASRSDVSLHILRKLEVLRNVTLLDRPIRLAAVVSTVQAALRGRQRQYELRDTLLALHKARNDAEHANRLKDEFLATVSHELRTPLNAIMGWISMLRQGRVGPERVGQVFEIVDRNAKAQAQLIADVLDISRMITGLVKVDAKPVVLSRSLLDAVDTVRPGAEARGIALSVTIDDTPTVKGDAERLQQVFWNVLSNACKFTPSGGRIDVTLTTDAEWARIQVTDTGVGIADDFLPYVFDRFRQADQTHTRAYGGLGLGLAIVKHLVEMHGGHVEARSSGLGKGATFEIQLPTAAAVEDIDVLADDGPVVFADLSGYRALVVDDDESTRELLVHVLTECGAEVSVAANARGAMEYLDAEVPSVIVADIGMPGEDGISMIRRVRERRPERGGLVPAVALSAYARETDREAALAAGFDAFLTKPALPADIVRAVEHLVARVAEPTRFG